MFTVALVGADGAGKTTVARAVVTRLPTPAVYVYMGVNLEASTIMLPTTRMVLGLRRWRGAATGPTAPPRRGEASRRGLAPRAVSGVKGVIRLGYLALEEAYRIAVASKHRREGRIVIYDRHFIADYHASDVAAGAGRPLLRRLHGALLSRYPKPDLTICLDAPPSVLWARKPEGRIEWIEQRREEYLRLADVTPNFVAIDAARPLDAVVDDVVDAITDHGRTRRALAPPAR